MSSTTGHFRKSLSPLAFRHGEQIGTPIFPRRAGQPKSVPAIDSQSVARVPGDMAEWMERYARGVREPRDQTDQFARKKIR
jgi:hypothetical protein